MRQEVLWLDGYPSCVHIDPVEAVDNQAQINLRSFPKKNGLEKGDE